MKIGQTPELPGAAATSIASKQSKAAASAADATAASGSAKGAAPADAAKAASASGVPVTLSRTAREIEQSGRTPGEFDAGRVKAVRSAIENGTFRINAGAIADKMLANAEEDIARSRG